MIRINNLQSELEISHRQLKQLAADFLYVNVAKLKEVKPAKKSVDARNKNRVHLVWALDVEIDGDEETLLASLNTKDAERYSPERYKIVKSSKSKTLRPIVIGSGPAGMFAALALAEAGLRPIVLERGKDVSHRQRDVELFWQTGKLNANSNVQFGEGGAGTFSDGKLMTGIKKDALTAKVLQELVAAGAPEEILYLAKPHIGTDKLAGALPNIRRKIESLGGEYRFENRLEDLVIRDEKIVGLLIRTADGKLYEEAAETVVLAVGHSARDSFEMLYKAGVKMVPKPFSLGARIEHRQEWIDKAQYGKFAGHSGLGAADYKLAVHLPNGRSVYTFCMCPGGVVVGAASEPGRVVTNGMSCFARQRENANSALLVGISEADFGGEHPLQGMYLQQEIEAKAFVAGGGHFAAPAQLCGDFLHDRPSRHGSNVTPSYRPGVVWGSLKSCLPMFVTEALKAGIMEMDKKLHGFAHPSAILTAPETRSSSPVRILRDNSFQSNISGLFPCGEGAGYAGGIVSSAVDGLRVASAII